jgi:phosphoglucosamine mutase
VVSRKLFGTDGIRGRVGFAPITPESVLKLGWAAGRVLADGNRRAKVVIGKDTRVSGYLLESALEAGLSAAGVNVSLIGPMPTPGIAYLTRTARAVAGIVVSASHNPYEDNGIKFFSAAGRKLPDETERRIEAMMAEPLVTVASAELGKAERFADAPGRYIEFCKSTVPQSMTLAGLRIVVDCSNGAAYQIAPHVFEELGASVRAIAVQPNGFNINDGCGSTQPEVLQRMVTAERADVGIALDGDGDRVILVDGNGGIVDGDRALFILSRGRHRRGTLGGGVVGTQMSNYGLEAACRQASIPFVRAPVGDRFVLEELISRGWQIGGESSGHIICLDKTTTGDGIIAALEVLNVMVETGSTLAELAAGMEVFPQSMINVRYEPVGDARFDPDASPAVRKALAEVERLLAGEGRVVLRLSGTEPVIRVMVEGRDPAAVSELTRSLADTVESAARRR